MYNQVGLDVLEFECCILEALNLKDSSELELQLELGLYSPSVLESLQISTNSIIENRVVTIARYKEKADLLARNHAPQTTNLSHEALEFLFLEFLAAELPAILKDISKFYDNNVRQILSSNVVHFEKSAQKIAKHNLHTHAAGHIVCAKLANAKIKDLCRVIPLLSYAPLKSFPRDRIEYLISQKYDYFEDRAACCAAIGDKIRSL